MLNWKIRFSEVFRRHTEKTHSLKGKSVIHLEKATGLLTSPFWKYAFQSRTPDTHCPGNYLDVNKASIGFGWGKLALVFDKVQSLEYDSFPCPRSWWYQGPAEAARLSYSQTFSAEPYGGEGMLGGWGWSWGVVLGTGGWIWVLEVGGGACARSTHTLMSDSFHWKVIHCTSSKCQMDLASGTSTKF